MSDVPIVVEVVRSGGFAGIEVRAVVDTSQLPADRAAEVETLVADLGDPAELAARLAAGPPPAADRFHYDVVLRGGAGVQALSVGEAGIPAPLRALIDVVLRERGTPS